MQEGILTQDEITEILSGKVTPEEMLKRWDQEDENKKHTKTPV